MACMPCRCPVGRYPVEVMLRANSDSSTHRVVHRILAPGRRCAVTAFHVRARPQIRTRLLWYEWSRWENILLIGDSGSRAATATPSVSSTGGLRSGLGRGATAKRRQYPPAQFLEMRDRASMVCVSMLNSPGPDGAGNRIVTLFSKYTVRTLVSFGCSQSDVQLNLGHSTASELGGAGNAASRSGGGGKHIDARGKGPINQREKPAAMVWGQGYTRVTCLRGMISDAPG